MLLVVVFSVCSLSCRVASVAGDILPRRLVYHLDCVETHRVHVSFADIYPPRHWSSFLLHAMSVISSLFTLSSSFLLITCPHHFSHFSVIFCMCVFLWLFIQSCLSLLLETSMSISSFHSCLYTVLLLSILTLIETA